jgi:hypothetical protein
VDELVAAVPAGDATSFTSPLPAPAGSELAVNVCWLSAPSGTKARRDPPPHERAERGRGTVARWTLIRLRQGWLDAWRSSWLRARSTERGEIGYVIRVLVDRRFRSDAAIERPVAIV